MAIAIKNVPVLKGSEALSFETRAKASIAQKATIKFTEQLQISSKRLKSKIILVSFLYEKCTFRSYTLADMTLV
ncbi:hypothetical protein HP439_02710 [Sphingobacterium shayense]|uniref:hypothetical protein n=1 Tax=Sphingobacterium shayense TaxID=626343 RepID=UPI001556239B|nr:hypothetical protein [Sphingobacterium shayense]NQD69632.1 hypothetical protein [Sphingobacterium shayense]